MLSGRSPHGQGQRVLEVAFGAKIIASEADGRASHWNKSGSKSDVWPYCWFRSSCRSSTTSLGCRESVAAATAWLLLDASTVPPAVAARDGAWCARTDGSSLEAILVCSIVGGKGGGCFMGSLLVTRGMSVTPLDTSAVWASWAKEASLAAISVSAPSGSSSVSSAVVPLPLRAPCRVHSSDGRLSTRTRTTASCPAESGQGMQMQTRAPMLTTKTKQEPFRVCLLHPRSKHGITARQCV